MRIIHWDISKKSYPMYALRKYEVPADTQTWVYLKKRKKKENEIIGRYKEVYLQKAV